MLKLVMLSLRFFCLLLTALFGVTDPYMSKNTLLTHPTCRPMVLLCLLIVKADPLCITALIFGRRGVYLPPYHRYVYYVSQ